MEDGSIFLWNWVSGDEQISENSHGGCLAPSPDNFSGRGLDIVELVDGTGGSNLIESERTIKYSDFITKCLVKNHLGKRDYL